MHDELKNQWGWAGYVTQKLAPCRLMANLIALLSNWWHLYAQLYDGESPALKVASLAPHRIATAAFMQSGRLRERRPV